MNYKDHLDLFGTPVKLIPCITGKGAPTTATDGVVGCLYMDTNNGNLYKRTNTGWKAVAEGTGGGGGGGGAATLIVTVDGDKASHTATDIFNHAAAGGVVLLNHYGSYFMLAHCSAETACFVYTANDAVDTVFIITEQGDVEETEISYATANVLNGIDAALDAIIAIQNALIGGETA